MHKSKMLMEFRICDFVLMKMLKNVSRFQAGMDGV